MAIDREDIKRDLLHEPKVTVPAMPDAVYCVLEGVLDLIVQLCIERDANFVLSIR